MTEPDQNKRPAPGPVDRRVGLLCCSFCGKTQEELPMLVRGMANVCICDACVDLCRDIVGMQRLSGGNPTASSPGHCARHEPCECAPEAREGCVSWQPNTEAERAAEAQQEQR